jgi:small nuclear ribonucleoprotein (snRNP)-like protein
LFAQYNRVIGMRNNWPRVCFSLGRRFRLLFLSPDMANFNRKYKKESCRTLLGFLRCLTDQRIQVDLYSGLMLVGILNDIDVHRNIHLTHVTLSRPVHPSMALSRLCIRYTNVRYIRIPDEINIMETIRQDLKQMNPKPCDIVGGGQKKRYVKHDEEYPRNLPVLGPHTM